MLSRDAIISACDTKPKRVDVPEWGGFVFVRALTAGEAENLQKDKAGGFAARMAARCICDENGKRVFEDADVVALEAKSAGAMNRVILAINSLNGLDEKADAAVGEASSGAV